jgi:hypothetical protein
LRRALVVPNFGIVSPGLDEGAQAQASHEGEIEHEGETAFALGGDIVGDTAALLIQSGWTGVNDVFSGSDNFFQS